jgi:2'-5' RNA ligase
MAAANSPVLASAAMARYFIGLLPPPEIQAQVNAVKQIFADRFASRKAQNSPPHLTLQPPFLWPSEEEAALQSVLAAFAKPHFPVPVQLSGFGAFPPRVVYVKVLATPELLHLQQTLMADLEQTLSIVDPKAKHRPFKPHITVAFRDLTQQNFHTGWAEYQDKPFHTAFLVPKLTLLMHKGQAWEVKTEFAFAGSTGKPQA